jgi:hypothetical protein
MLKKLLIPCLVAIGFVGAAGAGCRAHVRAPGVHAGARVGDNHHHHHYRR